MKRSYNVSLKPFNSFAVEARANQLLVLENTADLQTFADDFRFDPACDLVLGGGSNIVFAGDVEGTVILNRVRGKRIIEDHGDMVLVEASAGENWHELVCWSLDEGLSGLENLSLIPGLCGAAPIQNIGAYGVELSEVLDSVRVLDLVEGSEQTFGLDDCQLSYRDSRFKSTDTDRYLITHIRLCLRRDFDAKLDYPELRKELDAMGAQTPTAGQVSEAVVRLRRRKLPDPATIGNAGSFFKNPVIDRSWADALKRDFPDLPIHRAGDETAKLSAAWMIEHCGWKGRTLGGAAVSDQHALVLVNHGNATGRELLELANAIKESVQHRFGVVLEEEPHIVQA
jgi:UDP-N-acetylmuramate dehydrogenase